VEFDYCCVHAAFALRDLGIEAIMVNCNPETSPRTTTRPIASTSSRSPGGRLNIVERERPLGVVVQFGDRRR